MKKNRMMRLASILLVCVLLSTSVISGTFAKYVTSTKKEDSARVARWGVTFDSVSDLFATQYNYTDVKNGVAATYSVESSGSDNVVAPGTAGTGYKFSTIGTPEVSYVVTFDVDDATAETIYLDAYYPVEFKLFIGGTQISTRTNSSEHLVAAIEACSYMYDVDENKYYLSGNGGVDWVEYTGSGIPALELTWSWEFDRNEAGYDIQDTTLGYLASGCTIEEAKALTGHLHQGDYNLDIVFTITATATQVN